MDEIRVSHWANVFFFSALLHMPRKAEGYAVPTATAPLCGLLHCKAEKEKTLAQWETLDENIKGLQSWMVKLR